MNQQHIRKLLDYNPDTGVFIWLINKASVRAGDIAGCKNQVDGYRYIRVDKKLYSAHRLAFVWMIGTFPKPLTDHINGIRDDNRWGNLREASSAINNKNTRMKSINTSGFNGVTKNKRDGWWIAQAKLNGKHIYIGRFKEKEDATAARKEFDKTHGFTERHGK